MRVPGILYAINLLPVSNIICNTKSVGFHFPSVSVSIKLPDYCFLITFIFRLFHFCYLTTALLLTAISLLSFCILQFGGVGDG